MKYDETMDGQYHVWLDSTGHKSSQEHLQAFRAGYQARSAQARNASGAYLAPDLDVITKELLELRDSVWDKLSRSLNQTLDYWRVLHDNQRMREVLKDKGLGDSEWPLYARIMFQRKELKRQQKLIRELKGIIAELTEES